MMYLPRLCEHCLNPACVAVARPARSTSAGRRHRPDRPGQMPRLADVRPAARTRRFTTTGQTGKSESASSAIRASRVSQHGCRKPVSAASAISAYCCYDADRIEQAAVPEHERISIRRSSTSSSTPIRSEGDRAGARRWHPGCMAGAAARRSPVYKMAVDWKVAFRCIRNIARCRWSGTCRRCRRSRLRPTPVMSAPMARSRREPVAHSGEVPRQSADRR